MIKYEALAVIPKGIRKMFKRPEVKKRLIHDQTILDGFNNYIRNRVSNIDPTFTPFKLDELLNRFGVYFGTLGAAQFFQKLSPFDCSPAITRNVQESKPDNYSVTYAGAVATRSKSRSFPMGQLYSLAVALDTLKISGKVSDELLNNFIEFYTKEILYVNLAPAFGGIKAETDFKENLTASLTEYFILLSYGKVIDENKVICLLSPIDRYRDSGPIPISHNAYLWGVFIATIAAGAIAGGYIGLPLSICLANFIYMPIAVLPAVVAVALIASLVASIGHYFDQKNQQTRHRCIEFFNDVPVDADKRAPLNGFQQLENNLRNPVKP